MKAPVPLANLPISPLDVSFRRLLRKCEAMAAGSDDVWKTDPVFHSVSCSGAEQLLPKSRNHPQRFRTPHSMWRPCRSSCWTWQPQAQQGACRVFSAPPLRS